MNPNKREAMQNKASTDDTYDVFIYQWILEDINGEDDEGRYTKFLEVSGYGLDTENKNVYIKLVRSTFKPWLSLKLNKGRTEDDLEDDVNSICEKMFKTEITTSDDEKYEDSSIYLEKTSINKKLYFYSVENDMTVYRLYFPSNAKRRQFFYKKKDDHKKPYSINESETNINLQFLNENKLPSCGWITLHNVLSNPKRPYKRITRGDSCFECIVNPFQIQMKSNQEEHTIPKFRCLSFDLECYSDVISKFPNAQIASNCIFQIGVVTNDEHDEEQRYIFTLMPKDRAMHVDNMIVKRYESEADLLRGFLNFMSHEFNAHVLIGYNIFGFDIPFLKTRCEKYGIDMATRGRSRDRVSEYKEIKWSSSAYSIQEFYLYDYDGRIMIDLLTLVKRNYKLSNYKLSTVSEFFLGNENTKDPMTPKDIFAAYSEGVVKGDLETIARCGKYCVQDSNLVLKLYNKLQTFLELVEMARLCNVNISDLMLRGQQYKVYSLIYKKCYLEDRLVDSYDNLSVEEHNFLAFDKYQGAYVFKPQPGKYSNIIPYDFTSLYPTTLIGYNIDYTTLVFPSDYHKVKNEDCNIVRWRDEDDNDDNDNKTQDTQTVTEYEYKFYNKRIGVVPSLLKNLLEQRNATKKLLKASKNPFLKSVLEKRQLAYKLSANSVYGALGVNVGYLPNKVAAMSCTAMGRESIKRSAEWVKKNAGGKIIYGDSVEKNTPILISFTNDNVKLYGIEQYYKMYQRNALPYRQFKTDDVTLTHKEQIIFNSNKYRIMTHEGWGAIKRLIRHKCEKDMFKIYTTTGSIIVTGDHSLLLDSSSSIIQIKPKDLSVNEHCLLHCNDTTLITNNLIYQKEDWDLTYEQKNGYIFFEEDLEDKYVSYMFYTFRKKFPSCCFDFIIEYDEKTKTETQRYVIDLLNRRNRQPGLLLKKVALGKTTSFVYDIETSNSTFMAGTGCVIVKNTDSIYCSFPMYKTPKEVWDNAKAVEQRIIDANLFMDPMKLLFEEKVYKEFLILTKKRYVCYTTDETGIIDEKLSIRGIILARRDNSKWSRIIYEQVVRYIMDNKSFESLLEYMNDQILALLRWETSNDINDFVITKLVSDGYKIKPLPTDSISKLDKRFKDLTIPCGSTEKLKTLFSHIKDINSCILSNTQHDNPMIDTMIEKYKERSLPAHKQLANKQGERGQPVVAGSRIEYVIVEHHNDPNAKLFDKLEDPDYFCSRCTLLRLDRLYYIKSIVMCIDQLFNVAYNVNNEDRVKNFRAHPDPIATIYQYHINHFKIMKQLKDISKTTIVYKI